MDAIKAARLTLAVDPLGGTTLPYWLQIAEHYGLDIVPHQTLTNRFHLAFAHDPDSDLQGVVTPSAGLMLPHHYLAAAVHYLLANRPLWAPDAIAGKTLFTSSIFDRVAHKLGRRLCETPPGFQWFAPGLFEGSLCVAGEEHGGVAFLQHDGAAWTTIPDGPVMNLLAAEITARTGRDPAELYRALTGDLGVHWYARLDAPATPLQKARLLRLAPTAVRHSHLAGQPILAKLNRAPGSNTPIGGLKVVAASGWFAARPSPSEDLYRIYAESFEDQAHLDHILAEAREIVKSALTDTLHG
jgi:phosphoglucomutase